MTRVVTITQGDEGVYAVALAETGDGDGLSFLQGVVGGWIESVPTDESITIYCNEEGKIDGLPYNPVAMAFWANHDPYGCIENASDYIAGNIVILGPVDDEGNSTDVPDWVYDEIRASVAG